MWPRAARRLVDNRAITRSRAGLRYPHFTWTRISSPPISRTRSARPCSLAGRQTGTRSFVAATTIVCSATAPLAFELISITNICSHGCRTENTVDCRINPVVKFYPGGMNSGTSSPSSAAAGRRDRWPGRHLRPLLACPAPDPETAPTGDRTRSIGAASREGTRYTCPNRRSALARVERRYGRVGTAAGNARW